MRCPGSGGSGCKGGCAGFRVGLSGHPLDAGCPCQGGAGSLCPSECPMKGACGGESRWTFFGPADATGRGVASVTSAYRPRARGAGPGLPTWTGFVQEEAPEEGEVPFGSRPGTEERPPFLTEEPEVPLDVAAPWVADLPPEVEAELRTAFDEMPSSVRRTVLRRFRSIEPEGRNDLVRVMLDARRARLAQAPIALPREATSFMPGQPLLSGSFVPPPPAPQVAVMRGAHAGWGTPPSQWMGIPLRFDPAMNAYEFTIRRLPQGGPPPPEALVTLVTQYSAGLVLQPYKRASGLPWEFRWVPRPLDRSTSS